MEKTAATVLATVEHVQPATLAATAAVTQANGVEIVLVTVVNVHPVEMVVAMQEKTVVHVLPTVVVVKVVEMEAVMEQKTALVVLRTVVHVDQVAFVETSLVQPSKAAQLVPVTVELVPKTKLGSKSVVVT